MTVVVPPTAAAMVPVGGYRAAEGHVEVGMHVDRAGHD
jgi:hypothetical protein